MVEEQKSIKVNVERDSLKLSFYGEMTIYTATRIQDELVEMKDVLENEWKSVELDVSNVSDFDTSGMQLLIMVKRKALSFSQIARISGSSDSVSEAIRLYKVNDQLESSYNDVAGGSEVATRGLR